MLIVLLLGLLRLIAAFYKRSRRETLLLITIIGYFMILLSLRCKTDIITPLSLFYYTCKRRRTPACAVGKANFNRLKG